MIENANTLIDTLAYISVTEGLNQQHQHNQVQMNKALFGKTTSYQ